MELKFLLIAFAAFVALSVSSAQQRTSVTNNRSRHGLRNAARPSSQARRNARNTQEPLNVDVQKTTVKIGRQVVIDSSIVRVSPPAGVAGLVCRISVVSEPRFQVVGEVLPKTFNCDLNDGQVQYRHSGSTLLARDFVKLRVTVFASNNSQSREVELEVDVNRSAAYEYVPYFKPFEPTVEVRIRESSDAISTAALKIRYDPLQSKCRIAYRPARFWPVRGSLVSAAKTSQNAFDMDCMQFLLSAFRYEHHGDITFERDYLPFEITVTSISNSFQSRSEAIYVSVLIIGGKKNEAPHLSQSGNTIKVDTILSEPAVLSLDDMTVYDAESDSNDLVMSTVEFSDKQAGEFINLDSPNYAVSSFFVKDVSEGRIGIRLTYFSYSVEFSVHFVLTDIQQNCSNTLQTRIVVNLLTREPFHFFTQPVAVLTNGMSALTLANIQPKANQSSFIAALKILGLYKFENTRQPIASVEEQKITFMLGPVSSKYGQLVDDRGDSISSFKLRDLFSGNSSKVFYKHQQPGWAQCSTCLGTDYADKIELIANYSEWSTSLILPVRVITSDIYLARMLVRNGTLNIQRSQTLCLSPEHLVADELALSDVGVIERSLANDRLVFNVRIKPTNGLLTAKPYLNASIQSFSYAQVLAGMVCYKHTQPLKLADSLTVSSPFGDTGKLQVNVNGSNGAARPIDCQNDQALTVRETDVLRLNSFFRCRYADASEQGIVLRLVAQPYAPQTQLTDDCGKFIDVQERTDRTDSSTEISKQRLASYQPLAAFAQPLVAANRLYFVPQARDVGISARTVAFAFYATDGSFVTPVMKASITVLPVNNQPPKLTARRFEVKRAATVTFKVPESINVTDEDTALSALSFTIRSLPASGQLKVGNANARMNQSLSYANMLSALLTFTAGPGRTSEDTRFELAVSDGNNSQVFPIYIHIFMEALVTTRKPRSRSIVLNTTLTCLENQQVFLPSAIIDGVFSYSYADGSEDLSSVRLFILRYPTLGWVLKNGTRHQGIFTYPDMHAGHISYQHRGEVGFQSKLDSITFYVNTTDLTLIRSSPWAASILARTPFQLRINVTPVDNQSPRLEIHSTVTVLEGGKAQLLPEHFLTADNDTETSRLQFVVTQRPTVGQLEVRSAQTVRVVEEGEPRFTWDEFESGAVHYVQSVHRDVEPTSDRFVLSVTDGERYSEEKAVNIVVQPQIDEEPQLSISNFTVQEGATFDFDANSFAFSSADVPAVTLFFVLLKPPMHGSLRSGVRNITFFSSDDLRDRGRFKLNYRHDNTNTLNDSFTLRISNGVSTLDKTCTCYITVSPVNDDRPLIKVNRAIFGSTGSIYVLRNSDLLVTDSDTSDEQITFRLTSSGNAISGSFQMDEVDVSGEAFFTQADINAGRITYVFPESLDSGKRSAVEKASFIVSDGAQTIRMQFTINITADTAQTTLGEADFNFTAIEIDNVPLGGQVDLSPARLRMSLSLAARRLYQADSRSIVYKLQSVVNGRVVLKSSLLTPIDSVENIESFTRYDVDQRSVVYRAPEMTDAKVDEILLTVEVPRFGIAKELTIIVTFNLSAYEMPVVQRNDELSVVRRSRLAIADSKLLTTDQDAQPVDIVYRVMQQPKSGKLILDNALMAAGLVSISSFTQLDVNRNLVYYQHDDDSAASDDHFLFIVTDGQHTFFVDNTTASPSFLDTRSETMVKRIVITSSDEAITERSRQSWLNALQLRVATPENLQRFNDSRSAAYLYGYVISRDLFVIDFDLPESALAKQEFVERNLRDSVFAIVRQPSFGNLRFVNKRRQRVQNFTLSEVAAGQVRYIASTPIMYNSDYFTFNLVDAQTRLTLSSNGRVNFAWPVVEFAKGSLSVCYNTAGYLTFNLTQKGGVLNQTAAVRIILKDPANKAVLLSATLEQQASHLQSPDKILDDVSLLASPGVTHVTQTFNLRFNAPNSHQLILEELQNLVIGTTRTATISIINCTDGKTEDFIDMGRAYGLRREKTTPRPRATTPARRRLERTTGEPSGASGSNSRSLISAIGNAGPMNDPPSIGEVRKQPRKVSKRVRNASCYSHERNSYVYEAKTRVTLKCDGKRWTVVKEAEPPRAVRQATSCPSGWTLHNKFCYKAFPEKSSWQDAKKRCGDSASHLVTVQSKTHMEWLFGLNGRQTFWIGLHQNGLRKWEYTSKRKANYFEWAKGFPTGYAQSGKNCVLINNLIWYNRLCTVPTRFICELPARA